VCACVSVLRYLRSFPSHTDWVTASRCSVVESDMCVRGSLPLSSGWICEDERCVIMLKSAYIKQPKFVSRGRPVSVVLLVAKRVCSCLIGSFVTVLAVQSVR
jgi:hypothetical protein